MLTISVLYLHTLWWRLMTSSLSIFFCFLPYQNSTILIYSLILLRLYSYYSNSDSQGVHLALVWPTRERAAFYRSLSFVQRQDKSQLIKYQKDLVALLGKRDAFFFSGNKLGRICNWLWLSGHHDGKKSIWRQNYNIERWRKVSTSWWYNLHLVLITYMF